MDEQAAINITRRWLDKVVIALNLCPFASQVVMENSLRLCVSNASDDESIIHAILEELDTLQSSSEQEVATGLLIFSEGLRDFDHYLSVVELAQQLVQQVGLEGVFQVASFHPDYHFVGVATDDLGNYTNRSPLPMLHFIREQQLSRALATYPRPETIPENNIATLKAMGDQAVLALFHSLGGSD